MRIDLTSKSLAWISLLLLGALFIWSPLVVFSMWPVTSTFLFTYCCMSRPFSRL